MSSGDVLLMVPWTRTPQLVHNLLKEASQEVDTIWNEFSYKHQTKIKVTVYNAVSHLCEESSRCYGDGGAGVSSDDDYSWCYGRAPPFPVYNLLKEAP